MRIICYLLTYPARFMKYFVCLLSTCGVSQTYITTDSALQNAVNNDTNGGTYIVPNGTYSDFYCSFTKVASSANPVTIKAESVGGVLLTGDSHFVFKKAANIIFEGFDFECTSNNTLIKLEGSNNIRITRNEFELTATSSVKWIVVTGYYNDYSFDYVSNHNRIDHNNFLNKDTPGNYITIDGTYNQDQSVTQQSQYDLIDHNYFYNIGPRIENGMESIRIGNGQLSQSSGYTTVAFNYFDDCDGDPEIVSVKSCDNQINHNTFSNSYGSLTLRQGNRTHVEGNYFFGNGKTNGTYTNPSTGSTQTIYTGGIRAYGTDHVIINNYLQGLQGTLFDAPITLTQGDAITGVDTNLSLHYRAENVIIAYNTLVDNAYGIEIGYAKSNGSYNKPLINITLANNLVTGSTNSLVKIYNDQNGELNWSKNYMYPTGTAQLAFNTNTTFTTSEVSVQNSVLATSGTYWIATSSTPMDTNGSAIIIDQDIDGQIRPIASTVGADNYSNDAAIYFPMTVNDVGPNAYENVMNTHKFIDTTKPILLYPNPTNGIVHFNCPDEGIDESYTIQVLDVPGKLIKEQKNTTINNQLVLDLEDQPQGVYFIKLIGTTDEYQYRILKQ